MVVGVIMGLFLLLIGYKVWYISMVIYIFLWVVVLVVCCGLKSESVGWFFKLFFWKYGDVFFMCLLLC